MRHCLRLGFVCLILALTPLWAAAETPGWPGGKPVRVPVLMYHHVGPVPTGAPGLLRDLTVPTAEFIATLNWLRSAGAQVLTLRQAYELALAGRLPGRPVVLTFDDGYADNYQIIFALLWRYGYVGTFNVVSGTLNTPGHLTTEQMRQMADAGNEIGSHTVSHPDLRALSASSLQHEVRDSKLTLERLLGAEVATFCYPSGDENARVRQAVRQAGYRLGLSTQVGSNWSTDRLLALPRLRVEAKSNVPGMLLTVWAGHAGQTRPRHRSRPRVTTEEGAAW